jgi:alpha-beta hydrolase superfamily lysophospholipase
MFFRVWSVFWVGLLMAQPVADPAGIARKALDLLLGQKSADLIPMLAPAAKATFTEAALVKLGAEVQSWGAVEKIGDPSTRKIGTASVVTIPVKFASREINFQFGVSEAGQITALFRAPAAPQWQHPAYSKPEAFHEREVTVGEGEFKLPGTLTVPAGGTRVPGVVLVPTAGPQDRDETIGGVKDFKDLAEGLASRGIAVLRYEKRTRQYTGVSRSPNYTVEKDTIEDAVLAAALLRSQPEVNPQKVFVLGHGMGGYLAPRIAAADGKLAGLILVAANARPLEDVLLEQAIYLGATGKRLDDIKEGVAKVKALDPADTDAPPMLGMPATYIISLKDYDPVGDLRKLAVPILILQGDRDFETTAKSDLSLWKTGLASRKDAAFREYPTLNHLMVAGEGKSTGEEYRNAGHIAPEVIDDIAKWLAQ